jgi:hypothetical protein
MISLQCYIFPNPESAQIINTFYEFRADMKAIYYFQNQKKILFESNLLSKENIKLLLSFTFMNFQFTNINCFHICPEF